MADDQAPETLTNGQDNTPQAGVISQYVKDLSFENPNAPAVYQWQGQPQHRRAVQYRFVAAGRGRL